MIGVLGSGFGLYGHIPALVELGYPVRTLSRYRTKLERRHELAELSSKLDFVETDAEVLEGSVAVILARRPDDNVRQALSFLNRSSPPILVMEKPLAPTPRESEVFLRNFAHVRLCTPFLLRWCDWAPAMQEAQAAGVRQLSIDWGYSPAGAASHWKTDVAAGGGLLGFYFIHLIAFATHLFPQFSIRHFSVEPSGSGARLKLELLCEEAAASVSFEAGSARNFFRVSADDRLVNINETPFGAVPKAGVRDPRIDVLKRFYAEEVFGSAAPSQHRRIVEVWAKLRSRVDSLPVPENAWNVSI